MNRGVKSPNTLVPQTRAFQRPAPWFQVGLGDEHWGLMRFGGASVEPVHKARNFKELPVQEGETRGALMPWKQSGSSLDPP